MGDPRGPLAAGLDTPCPACERPSGDHTLREWNDCIGAQSTHLPYEDMPADIADAASENLRRSFNLDDDLIVADHVVARAVTLDGASGPVTLRIPAVLHEFQVGVIGQAPTTVARVLFAGGSDSIRGYGRLIRDTANGAVNAAQRAT